jgi:hypothetical protein
MNMNIRMKKSLLPMKNPPRVISLMEIFVSRGLFHERRTGTSLSFLFIGFLSMLPLSGIAGQPAHANW